MTLRQPPQGSGAAGYLRILKLALAGVGSGTPALVAVTLMVCLPGFSFFDVYGEVQALAAVESIWHWNVAPSAGSDTKEVVGVLSFDFFFGAFVMTVLGGAGGASIVQFRVAGLAS